MILYQKKEIHSSESAAPKSVEREKKELSQPKPEKKAQESESTSQKVENTSVSGDQPPKAISDSDEDEFHRKRIERRVRKTHSVVEDKNEVITKPGNQKDEVRKKSGETNIKNQE